MSLHKHLWGTWVTRSICYYISEYRSLSCDTMPFCCTVVFCLLTTRISVHSKPLCNS